MKENSWIQTYTGVQFFPFEPKIDDIIIEDIAHSLANQCRFNGHTNRYYSVAQHCVNVSRICRIENALWGLIHDGTEAYFADIPTPIKRYLTEIRVLEEGLAKAIAEKFNLPYPMPSDVKIADKIMLNLEGRSFMGWTKDYYVDESNPKFNPKNFVIELEPFGPKKAEKMFLKDYDKILKNLEKKKLK